MVSFHGVFLSTKEHDVFSGHSQVFKASYYFSLKFSQCSQHLKGLNIVYLSRVSQMGTMIYHLPALYALHDCKQCNCC